VSQVRGFVDQRLRNPKDPLEASNRRISIIVEYVSKDNTEDVKAGEETRHGSEGAAKNNGAEAATKDTEQAGSRNE
jgi:hypothetical protein